MDFEGVHFNVFNRNVTIKNQSIYLTEIEFNLALLFFRNIGKTFSRNRIMELIWGRSDVGGVSRSLDAYVYRVRKKLDLVESNGWNLMTVYGRGYRLEKLPVFTMPVVNEVSAMTSHY